MAKLRKLIDVIQGAKFGRADPSHIDAVMDDYDRHFLARYGRRFVKPEWHRKRHLSTLLCEVDL